MNAKLAKATQSMFQQASELPLSRRITLAIALLFGKKDWSKGGNRP
jgi:hypothetical protein